MKTFPLANAQLAVDIHSIRAQLSQLCNRMHGSYPSSHDAVFSRLADALNNLSDAVEAALTIDKT